MSVGLEVKVRDIEEKYLSDKRDHKQHFSTITVISFNISPNYLRFDVYIWSFH